jgi:2-dehydro-3-deoxygalactonokinase
VVNHENLKEFLSCDWGTTSFRIRLVESPSCNVLAEESSTQGISSVYESWQQSGHPVEKRFSYYQEILEGHITKIENAAGKSLADIPVIISGMASSTIGMIELPYSELPFSTDGIGLNIKIIPQSQSGHELTIISGVKSDTDIMRGEETKIVGVAEGLSQNFEHLFILPGTHPKHALVASSKVIGFHTFMTGEFFKLLSEKSILSHSVELNDEFYLPINRTAFEMGVIDGRQGNLLHSSFMVRTNVILNRLSKTENYFYLSGLLIGTELRDIVQSDSTQVNLIADKRMYEYYSAALEISGISSFTHYDADKAFVRGQYNIIKGER